MALASLACGGGPAKYCEQGGFSSLVVDSSGVYAYSDATATVKRLLSSPDDSLDHAAPRVLAQRTLPAKTAGSLGGFITSDDTAVYWTLDAGSTIDSPVPTVQRMDKMSGAITTIARATQGILPLVPDGGWLYGFDLIQESCNGTGCTFVLALRRMPSTGGAIETLFQTAPGPKFIGYDQTVLDAGTVWFTDTNWLLSRAPGDGSAGPVVVWSDRPVQDLFLDAQHVYFTGGQITSSCGVSCTLMTDPSGTFRADKKTLAVEQLTLSIPWVEAIDGDVFIGLLSVGPRSDRDHSHAYVEAQRIGGSVQVLAQTQYGNPGEAGIPRRLRLSPSHRKIYWVDNGLGCVFEVDRS